MIKKIRNDVASNIRQIIECLILLAAIIGPMKIDVQNLFKDYLENNYPTPDNFIWYTAIAYGKYAVAFALLVLLLGLIRKSNKEFLMNQKNVYHNYCYLWYWFCSKILGIKKCNFVLAPIFMQCKLVIRGTFDEYPLDEKEYPSEESECVVEIKNKDKNLKEINLILEDTYLIEDRQIPKNKSNNYTIKISRNNGCDNVRHFSESFVGTTMNVVRGLKKCKKVNVFATTNPMNTYHIAKRVFAMGDRGNIKELYVFQQNGSGIRRFEEKGNRIF